MAKENKTLTLGYDEATGKVNSWSGTIVKSNKGLDDAAEKTRKVIDETESYRLELEKIQSNERIKNIEASVSLDIAEVEANADKVVALAKTIGEAFGRSTDLVGDLFGGFDDASRSTQIEISKQIRNENKLREDQLEQLQKKTDAEIEWIKARTRALKQGDAMIKIQGDGLAPHLEAFMFEILENIQARVNAAGEEMLLRLDGS